MKNEYKLLEYYLVQSGTYFNLRFEDHPIPVAPVASYFFGLVWIIDETNASPCETFISEN